MSIGVAIPTYVKHLPLLQSLLENIANSTVKPERISVSCSSMNEDKKLEGLINAIPVTIQYTTRVLNPSQNRNRAASILTTDLISFIDGDDLMHPMRLKCVRDVFLKHPSVGAAYHGYEYLEFSQRNEPFPVLGIPTVVVDRAVPNPNGVGIDIESHPLHHAHVTVRRGVFSVFRFDESPRYNRVEDSVYANVLVSHGIPTALVVDPLSRYIKAPI